MFESEIEVTNLLNSWTCHVHLALGYKKIGNTYYSTETFESWKLNSVYNSFDKLKIVTLSLEIYNLVFEVRFIKQSASIDVARVIYFVEFAEVSRLDFMKTRVSGKHGVRIVFQYKQILHGIIQFYLEMYLKLINL